MKKIAVAVMMIVFSYSLLADDTSRGCGLGTLALPQKTLLSTTTANTVDAFSYPTREFATTSGTSGCAKHSLVLNEQMKAHFVANNLEQIKFESAIGAGESLEVLARTFGCKDSGVFGAKLQSQYEMLSNKDEKNFLNSVNELVKKDAHLNTVCPLSA